MQRTDSFEKTLMLGKIEDGKRRGDRGWNGWMASLTQWTWVWANSGTWWWTGKPGMLQSLGSQIGGHDWVTELNMSQGAVMIIHSFPSLFFQIRKFYWSVFKFVDPFLSPCHIWYSVPLMNLSSVSCTFWVQSFHLFLLKIISTFADILYLLSHCYIFF